MFVTLLYFVNGGLLYGHHGRTVGAGQETKEFWFTDREICILLNDETDHIVPLKLKLSSDFPLRSALISLPLTGFLAYVFKALTTI